MEIETQGPPVYEPPAIVDFGLLRDLTAAQSVGSHLDAGFPDQTPNEQLTFSFPPTGG